MKLKALQDFNLGSMSEDYQEGDVLEVSDPHGKELITAGLAEKAGDEAKSTRKPKPGESRSKKPAVGPTETKDEAAAVIVTETK